MGPNMWTLPHEDQGEQGKEPRGEGKLREGKGWEHTHIHNTSPPHAHAHTYTHTHRHTHTHTHTHNLSLSLTERKREPESQRELKAPKSGDVVETALYCFYLVVQLL